jgi:uncharacterized protein (DUF1800 family)
MLKHLLLFSALFSSLYSSIDFTDSCKRGYRESSTGWTLVGSGSEIRDFRHLKDSEYVFTYQNGEWRLMLFSELYESSSIKKASSIPENSGFWVFSQKRLPIPLDGSELEKRIHLKEGWNLVGSNSYIDDLNGTFNSEAIRFVWLYDSGDWILFSPEDPNNYGFPLIEKIERNDGLWIYSEDNISVVIPPDSQPTCRVTLREFTVDSGELNISLSDLNLTGYSVDKEFSLPETLVFDNRTITGTMGNSKRFSISFKDESNSTVILRASLKNSEVTRGDAFKLLRQASFIAEEGNISYIMENGVEAWIDYQLALPSDSDSETDDRYGYLQSMMEFLNRVNPETYTADVIADPVNNLVEYLDKERKEALNNVIIWRKFFHNDDQLRQRVAYALSQLLVISEQSTVGNGIYFRAEAVAQYYDNLVKHSFGNFRDLLSDVSKSSAMGYFLTFIGGKKYDPVTGVTPDENYARELMQLFTIGLYKKDINGTIQLDNKGNPIPSYTQDDVSELSRVFTGWDLPSSLVKGDKGYSKTSYGSNSYYVHSYLKPLQFTEEYHDYGEKTVLGETIEANLTAEEDRERALDIIFANQNIAPHVSQHLIMRLVTSNPTPQYIERVASVFNDNGDGVKGDLGAVVKAILMDPEARGENIVPNFGKVEEFVIATTHLLHALNAKPLPHFYFYDTTDKNAPRVKIENEYWFYPYSLFYDQEPLNAGTVFNFYSPEYIPSDNHFTSNSLVAPELELRDTNNVVNFSNMFFTLLNYEKYRMLRLGLYNPKGATTMEEWVDLNDVTRQSNRNIYLDLEPLYNRIEMALDGDTNSTFENLNSEERGHKTETGLFGKGVLRDHLIDYLDYKMFGSTLSRAYKKKLLDQLMTHTNNKEHTKMQNIVNEAVRILATSPEFMVLSQ